MKLLTPSISKPGRKPRSLRRQAGVSLVEVMVAMLVTTAGLLGFAGLQTRALNATEDAYLRTQAMSLGQDLLERMRINGVSPDQQSFIVNAPGYTVYSTESNWTDTLDATPPDEVTYCYPQMLPAMGPCGPAEMAAADIYKLRERAQNTLPSGDMLMRGSCSTNQACVYVAWGGTTAADCASEYTSLGTVPRQCVVAQGI